MLFHGNTRAGKGSKGTNGQGEGTNRSRPPADAGKARDAEEMAKVFVSSDVLVVQ